MPYIIIQIVIDSYDNSRNKQEYNLNLREFGLKPQAKQPWVKITQGCFIDGSIHEYH
jgi:hypothetical protein